jgi:hypothetical protein
MKNRIISTCLLFCCIHFCFAQKTQVKHLGNTFNIKVESSKNDKISIYITNETNANWAKNIQISNNITEAQFQKKLDTTFNLLINQYIFSSASIDRLSIGPKNFIKTDSILKVDKKLFFKDFIPNKKVLNKRFKEALKYTSFKQFAESLDDNSFKNITTAFTIKKEEDSYKLNETIFKDEITFLSTLNKLAIKETDKKVLDYFYSKEDIKKTLDTTLSDENSKKIADLYKSSLGKDPFIFVGNFIAEDSVTVYDIGIKQFAESNFFTLRFCGSNAVDCKYSIKIAFDVEVAKFKTIVASKLKDNKKLTEEETLKLFLTCKDINTKIYQKTIKAPIQREFDSLINAIENAETKYSGVLKLNNRVNIYKMIKTNKKNLFGKKLKKEVKLESSFIPKYATVRFFNNRANNIVVVGVLVNEEGKTVSKHVSVSFQNSIPIRSFNSSLNLISLNEANGNNIGYINYNEVFNYYPFEEKFNYSVKNNEYKVTAGDTIKIEQRKLADFFTPVIFSDILGLNPGSENGLIFAEGRARIPLWLHNFGKTSLIPALRTDINVSLYNGFDENSRSINQEGITPIETSTLNINPFDYVKYANINASISLDVINFELKGLATDISFGTGIRYYRAAFRYTQTNTTGKDIVFNDQLNMLAPEVNVNFQIRPQTNFGADLNLSYSWLHARGTRENTTLTVPNTLDDKKMFRLNLDLYSKVSPKTSNGGIYARIGGFYHIETQDFYPQIMVGYATNLSSFINKFKKK